MFIFTIVIIFGQFLFSVVQIVVSSSIVGFSGFGNIFIILVLVIISQSTLIFSSIIILVFNIFFGLSIKFFLVYLGVNVQLAFGVIDGQQQGIIKLVFVFSFGSFFIFGNFVVVVLIVILVLVFVQLVFGSVGQSVFGGLKFVVFVFGVFVNIQLVFGSITVVFFFGVVIIFGFGVIIQIISSGISSLMFGSITLLFFIFGGLVVLVGSAGFGINVVILGISLIFGVFSFGGGQSGIIGSIIFFGVGLSQITLGVFGQSIFFVFNVVSIFESKFVFGGKIRNWFVVLGVVVSVYIVFVFREFYVVVKRQMLNI